MKKSQQEKIDSLLTRNVEVLIVKEELIKKLLSGKKLRIKLGIDPTNPQIHIGRATVLWKLREFQDLGHKITLVIGTFTGVIGDSSDKDSERPSVEKSVIEDNAKLYAEQIGKILDISKVEFFYNGDWFNKMKLQDFFKLTNLFTIQQMIERENFAKRIEAGKPVGIQETLYPMLQGYDSVEMKTDIEVGGTDQLFNLLAGRVVQKAYGQAPQSVMTFHLMEGTDGRKMSSSWGNCIYITDEPGEMYAKVMTIRDELIPSYFRMATDVPLDVVEQIEKDMAGGDNPRDTKASLARAITARYHGEKAANDAEATWNKQFREGEKPKDIETIKIKPGKLVDLIGMQFDLSKSEVKRIIDQSGVRVDDEVVKDIDFVLKKSALVQVGKRRFVKFKI